MKSIKRNYMIDKFLKKINNRLDYALDKYSKSICEFNPAENNYYYGYLKACEHIKKDLFVDNGDGKYV